MTFGALPAEWDHLSLILGLTSDLLPVVSNPNATISPQSKMKSLGKTPSRYNGRNEVAGIKDWTQKHATIDEVTRWRDQPDYGICIQTRTVRALDVDIENEHIAKEIHYEIEKYLARILPMRRREGSTKFLLLLQLTGDMPKRVIQTDHGIIEFLATGQQFIACGTHPSGARYEWVGGLPEEIPELQPHEFEKLWARLIECFAAEGTTSSTEAPTVRHGKISEAAQNDPVAQSLVAKGFVKSTERDGRLHITCPFEAEHTAGSDDSATTYFPAFTGGFARGHFACLHAHCAKRTDGEFLDALGISTGVENDFTVEVSEQPTTASGTSPGANKYVVEPWSKFKTGKPPRWIVKSVIPEAALAVIFGEPGSGKTFFALDVGIAIAMGLEWRGFVSKPGAVVYIAAEDATGVRQRIAAYAAHHDLPEGIPLGVLADSPNFLKGEDVTEVLKAIRAFGPVSVVFVDTWAQVTPGANENSGEDMGRALSYCKALHKATGALIVLIHHSGKDASKGARGWSGLNGAADCMIEVNRADNDRTATIVKQKNAQDGATFGFKLKTVPIGHDDDGDPITSCVLEHVDAKPRAQRGSKKTKGPNEETAMRVLNDLCVGGAVPMADAVRAVADNMLYDDQGGKQDKRRYKAELAINALGGRGMLLVTSNTVDLWREE